MSFNITPVASGYQEIHPYSAMNIDSVKINTSLIMMKEWVVHPLRPRPNTSLLSAVFLAILSFILAIPLILAHVSCCKINIIINPSPGMFQEILGARQCENHNFPGSNERMVNVCRIGSKMALLGGLPILAILLKFEKLPKRLKFGLNLIA